VNPDNRTRLWISNTLTGLSELKNKKGLEIIYQCGAACCESEELYKGAIETGNNDK
jgi:hypothetical protein